MTPSAQKTVRNVGWLFCQKVIQVVSGLLFALLVPRNMGPQVYGQYVLLYSLGLWFVVAANLGFTQVLSRYVPGCSQREQVSGHLEDREDQPDGDEFHVMASFAVAQGEKEREFIDERQQTFSSAGREVPDAREQAGEQ